MLSVIVPMYNVAHVLPATVPAMLAQEGEAEWIFVDDGSTDETHLTLKRLVNVSNRHSRASVRVLTHEVNRGRGAARNTGLAAAKGEFVVFLDADASPTPFFLRKLSQAATEPGAVAAVGCLQMVGGDPKDAYVRYVSSSMRGPSKEHAHRPTPWKYFLTTASCVRLEILASAGGFDESITYGEDIGLAVRIAADHPDGLRYAPEAVVRLHDLGTLDTALAKMQEFGQNNLPRMVHETPELARWTGIDVVDSNSGLSFRGLAAKALLRPWIAGIVRDALPYLRGWLSNRAVRYLLGYTLAMSYKEGLRALQSP